MAVYKRLGHGTPVRKRKEKKLRQEKFAHNSTKFITFTSKFCKYGIPLSDDFSRGYELGLAFKKTLSILQCKS